MFAIAINRGISLATCGGWALLTLAQGLVFKPIFMWLEYPSRELIELNILDTNSFDEYWMWSLALLFPYFIFIWFMFHFGRYGTRREPVFPRHFATIGYRFNELALVFLVLVAIFAVFGFLIQFPQLLEGGNKNTLATSDLSEYDGGGIWRTLIKIGYFAAFFAMMNLGMGKRKSLNAILVIAGSVAWLFYCFFSDQRGLMLFSIIAYMIGYTRYIGKIPKGFIIFAVVAGVFLVLLQTITRLNITESGLDDTIEQSVGNLIGRNYVENSKTISIIKAIPRDIDYQFGKTYFDSLLMLVPRAIFPSKSTVNLDTIIGNKIYDCYSFGSCAIPPGVIAESYLNFGLIGVPVLAALAGALIGLVDRRYRVAQLGSIEDIFFVSSLIFVGMGILGSGFSSIATDLILAIVLIAFIVVLSGRRYRLVVP